jgi:AcrR family transcriptional regulator
MQPSSLRPNRTALTARCLDAFVQAGTIDLSLDKLSATVGISKRMLIHYFSDREHLEESAIALLEKTLRAQFAGNSFPPGTPPRFVVMKLWEQSTAPQARNVLLLLMDLSRRAWSGSPRAKAFYAEQWQLWARLLAKFMPDQRSVEEVLQLFQGAVLAYLVTGDPEPGKRSLIRYFSRKPKPKTG